MMEDYRPIPQLDVYDTADLAPENERVRNLSANERAAAEREMRRRDLARARGRREGRLPRVLGMADDSEDEQEEEPLAEGGPQVRRRRLMEPGESSADQQEDFDDNAPIIENLEDFKGHTLREWVSMESTQREIYRRFRNFLTTSVDEHGNNVHGERIKTMCENNGESLVISYPSLCREQPVLAIFVADAPTEMLKIFDSAAKEVVRHSFPEYESIRSEIHVRISELPVSDNLRDIRQQHLNALIKVTGVVTKRTSVFPQLKLVKYDCVCGFVIGPIVVDWTSDTLPRVCPNCQRRGPFRLNAESTIYRNFQRITIQESQARCPRDVCLARRRLCCLRTSLIAASPGTRLS